MSYILRVIPEDVYTDLVAKGLVLNENEIVLKSQIKSHLQPNVTRSSDHAAVLSIPPEATEWSSKVKNWKSFDSQFKIKK